MIPGQRIPTLEVFGSNRAGDGKKPVVLGLNRGRLSPKPVKLVEWCAREDLNLQSLRNQILSLACLPFHHARSVY